MGKKRPQTTPGSPRMLNRKARMNYHVTEVVECGLSLVGTEVKSLREGLGKIDESYARIRGGELFLIGAHIAAYRHAAVLMQHDPARDRKLLLHRNQIAQIQEHLRQKGNTVVPLSLYFSRGWAKVELGLARGKKQYDKRQDIKKREQQREMKRYQGRRAR